MATYKILTELGTGQLLIHKAGKTVFTYDPLEFQVFEPSKKCPYDLTQYYVYWNTSTSEYVLGSALPTESQDITDYIGENAIWTDSVTGLSGRPEIIQSLVNRREIFNDSENPLYVSGFVGLNASNSNMNSIHSKLGWHNQEIQTARWHGPKKLLIHYGWPSSFNYGTLAWDNEKISQEMCKYDLIVFGSGLADSGHTDYANLVSIVNRIKVLRPDVMIFGYVTANQTQTAFEDEVDEWDTVGVHGIFMDECGYDSGVSRTNFNAKVDYVHSATNATICFANAWNWDHILGTENDASYPNATWNSTEAASNLTSSDWCLLESYGVNTSSYSATGNDGYESKASWAARTSKAISHRATYGINAAGSGTIANSSTSAKSLFHFGYVSALMASLDAFGVSDINYGATNNTKVYWPRPALHGLGNIYNINANIQVHPTDTDVYYRFLRRGVLALDFSASDGQFGVIKRYSATINGRVCDGSDETGGDTTQTSFQAGHTISTPYLSPGVKYRVSWYYEVGRAYDYDVEHRVRLDDGSTPITIAQSNWKNPISATDYHSVSGFFESDELVGVYDISAEYRVSGGTGSAYMRRIRLTVDMV